MNLLLSMRIIQLHENIATIKLYSKIIFTGSSIMISSMMTEIFMIYFLIFSSVSDIIFDAEILNAFAN